MKIQINFKLFAILALLIISLNFPAFSSNTVPTIRISIEKIDQQDNKKLVQFKMTEIRTGQPVTLNLLKETHLGKIHLLIINSNLQDYSHVHPKATKIPGIYEFVWQPKNKTGHYRLWADLLPKGTGQQEYVISDLTTKRNTELMLDRTVFNKSIIDGYTFQISFDTGNLKVGRVSMGKMLITDLNGRSIKNLRPVMGAFAHIVGFSEDFNTIIHIHPMGNEPTRDSDRGGPVIEFHIEPEQSGFIKLFAQVNIGGKELFVPFGFQVNE